VFHITRIGEEPVILSVRSGNVTMNIGGAVAGEGTHR